MPKRSHREICYKEECAQKREARWNRTKVEKVKRLRESGKWKEHRMEVVKKQKQARKQEFNECLKCGKDVPKPGHFCPACRDANRWLTSEYSEEALGIADSPFDPQRLDPNRGMP